MLGCEVPHNLEQLRRMDHSALSDLGDVNTFVSSVQDVWNPSIDHHIKTCHVYVHLGHLGRTTSDDIKTLKFEERTATVVIAGGVRMARN